MNYFPLGLHVIILCTSLCNSACWDRRSGRVIVWAALLFLFWSQKPQQLAWAPSNALISAQQSFRHPTSPLSFVSFTLYCHTHTQTGQVPALQLQVINIVWRSLTGHTPVHGEIKPSHFESSATISLFYLESYWDIATVCNKSVGTGSSFGFGGSIFPTVRNILMKMHSTKLQVS